MEGGNGLDVPEFAGSYPAEAVRIFQSEKILSAPSFGGEVKPSVPCRRFTACKRSLNGVEVAISAKFRNFLAHTVPPFAARISRVVTGVEAPGGEGDNDYPEGGVRVVQYALWLQYTRGISYGP